MRTNIDIDDNLMRQAMRSSGARTKRAAVEEDLRLLIRTREQRTVRRLRGKVAWTAIWARLASGRQRSICQRGHCRHHGLVDYFRGIATRQPTGSMLHSIVSVSA